MENRWQLLSAYICGFVPWLGPRNRCHEREEERRCRDHDGQLDVAAIKTSREDAKARRGRGGLRGFAASRALSFAAQMRRIAILFLLAAASASAQQPVLRWGGDAEGGAPFVEADPNDPAVLRGFDVEVAQQIAKGLGRRAEFRQGGFNDIDQPVQRGDFDIGMN